MLACPLHSVAQELEVHGVARQENMQMELETKDREIELLSAQIVEFTDVLDKQTEDQLMASVRIDDTDKDTPERLRLQLKDAENTVERLQKQVLVSEKDRVELLHRMEAYERGQGLSAVVKEAKEAKIEVAIRDAEIAKKTKEANEILEELDEVAEQNEVMMAQLGITEVDATAVESHRKRKFVEGEQLRSQNSELLRDIERLEAERVLLKKKVLHYAMVQGEMAAGKGVKFTDMSTVAAMEFDYMATMGTGAGIGMPGMARMPGPGGGHMNVQDPREIARVAALERDLEDAQRKLQDAPKPEMLAKLEDANAGMRKAIMELGHQVSQGSNGGEGLSLPSVDALASILGSGLDPNSASEIARAKAEGQNKILSQELAKVQQLEREVC